jgi:hypothetical protein
MNGYAVPTQVNTMDNSGFGKGTASSGEHCPWMEFGYVAGWGYGYGDGHGKSSAASWGLGIGKGRASGAGWADGYRDGIGSGRGYADGNDYIYE